MAIYFGSDKIAEIYHGSDKIKEVWCGSDLVWSGSKPSYAILTDNTRIDFELTNTPIGDLCSYGDNIKVSGMTILKTQLKQIVFGSSYKSVTSIPGYFLRNCTSLTSIDLSSFTSVTSISWAFLQNCTSLTSIDVSVFANVTSIKHSFLMQCRNLTSINIGGLLESKIIDENNQSFQAVGFYLTGCTIYADTLAIGNTYKSRFISLENWTVVVN